VDLKALDPKKLPHGRGWEFNRLTAVLTVGTSDGGPTYSSYPAGPYRFRLNMGDLRRKTQTVERNMATPPISCPTNHQSRQHLNASLSQDDVGSMSSRTGTQTGSTITLDNHGQSLAALFQTFGKATILTGAVGAGNYPFLQALFYQFGVASRPPSPAGRAIAVSILHRPLWLVEIDGESKHHQGWHSFGGQLPLGRTAIHGSFSFGQRE